MPGLSQQSSDFLDSVMAIALHHTEHLGDTPQRVLAIRKYIDPAYQVAAWIENQTTPTIICHP